MTDASEPSAGLERKLDAAVTILRKLQRVVVAFSAGVDSTFLLALAAKTLGGPNVLAAVGTGPSLPQRELDSARQYVAQIGVELVELPTGEMEDARYLANSSQRCYFCKSDLFGRLTKLASARGGWAVVSGANADDAGDHRPGLRAGRELGVVNPLMEAGLTKADIRIASQAMGLPTWDKPAMACLASRVPYGQAITAERLSRIEQAERALRDLGFAQVRVRDYQELARLELPAEDLRRCLDERVEVTQRLRQCGYLFVTMDLDGFRSGSMNAMLAPSEKQP